MISSPHSKSDINWTLKQARVADEYRAVEWEQDKLKYYQKLLCPPQIPRDGPGPNLEGSCGIPAKVVLLVCLIKQEHDNVINGEI